jgi:hypothetical protein
MRTVSVKSGKYGGSSSVDGLSLTASQLKKARHVTGAYHKLLADVAKLELKLDGLEGDSQQRVVLEEQVGVWACECLCVYM